MRFSKVSAIILLVVFLMAIPLVAQEPAGKVKKVKLKALDMILEGDFITILDLFVIPGNNAGVGPAMIFGPFDGFGILYKDKKKVSDGTDGKTETEINVRASYYEADGTKVGDAPALQKFDESLYNAVIVYNKDKSQYGSFYSYIDKNGALIYAFQARDLHGNPVGDPTLVRKVDTPMGDYNGKVTLNPEQVRSAAEFNGFHAVTNTNSYESGDEYKGWGTSQSSITTVNNDWSVDIVDFKLPGGGKGQFNKIGDANFEGDQATVILNSETYVKTNGTVYCQKSEGNIYVGITRLKATFAPAAKTKMRSIAKSTGYDADFHSCSVIPAQKDGGNKYAFYGKEEYKWTGDPVDNMLRTYYLQEINSKGKKVGKAKEVKSPKWVHKLKDNPKNTTFRNEEYIPNWKGVGNGKFVALQLRNLIVDTPDAPAPAAKLVATEFEANIVMFDFDNLEITKVGQLKLKGSEGEYFYNPKVLVTANNMFISLTRNHVESWAPKPFYGIVKLSDIVK